LPENIEPFVTLPNKTINVLKKSPVL